MNRVQRVLVGLLAAYAATMTLVASQRSAEAWVYRHFYDPGSWKAPDHPPARDPLMTIARDYGFPRTWMESVALQIADLRRPVMVPLIAAFFLLGLGTALIRTPLLTNLDKD